MVDNVNEHGENHSSPSLYDENAFIRSALDSVQRWLCQWKLPSAPASKSPRATLARLLQKRPGSVLYRLLDPAHWTECVSYIPPS